MTCHELNPSNHSGRAALWALNTAAALLLASVSCAADRTPSEVRLYALQGGYSTIPDKAIFHPDYQGQGQLTVPVMAFLLVHPRGTMVWDTGHDDSLMGVTRTPTIGFGARVEVGVEQQLRSLGYAPDDIDFLAVSHWHLDHVGNVRLFPRSVFLTQADEYDYAFSVEGRRGFGLRPRLYASLEHNPRVMVHGDHDVFGDGTVRIIRVGGHTIGSQILVVKLAERTVILSGDIYHFAEQRAGRRVPSFNYDEAETRAAMDTIERLLVTEPNAELWITHDPEQMGRLRLAPYAYR